ncbi:MAG TPA: M43 family zinc metalloprotease, partial [Saprospiraceae bacterium]|nr:M43 family zinc metalloprotease [Saprospiraceae bacterium]
MILFLGINFPTLAQEPCGFDERIREAKLSGENYIDRSKKLIKQAIASGAVNNKMQHTIPVVVHVIHLGEPIGIGTNISNAQIESAITNLNERFSNANGLGVDVEIDFCLATKDPFGNDLPNGAIVRENGFGVCAGGACYENVGITSANELEVKALSNWPNCDYYNVWVVSEINGNNGGSGVQGYAYFPGAPNGIDGTVMLYNAFGTVGNLKPNTDLNTIFTHELGHGLGLFHTFEGDCPNSVCLDANGNFDCNLTICPSLDPSLGDEVADTDAHRRSCSNCDISGMNTCYNPSRPNSNIITNYMDYSSQDCQTKFTAGQKTIMQAVMATERSCLSTSLGCLEECGSVDADFTGPLASTAGVEVDFINTSIGATNFIWEIDGVEVGTSTDLLDYVFDYQGFFKVCLIASNAQCTDFYCYDIAISGQYNGCEDFELDKCDVILNGDFSQPSGTASFSYSPSPIYEFDRVCNWFNRISSPDYCGNINQRIPSFFMYSLDSNNESIGTVREIPFVEGEEYEISFKYEVNSYSIPNTIELGALKVGLSQTREASGLVQDLLVLNPPNDFIPDDRPVVWCEQELLNQHSFSFIYDPSIHGKYLYVEPVPSTVSGGYHIVRVGDIHVYSCEPECFPDPDFTFTVNNCNEVDFVGDNFGDPGSYNWDFGYNNETGTGKNISHTFLYDGTFDVCLTIECGQEFESETICQEVIIDGCEDCGEADITDVVLCDQNGNGNYLGHIEFLIPEDVSICDTDPEAWSPEVSILVNNWNFSQAGAGQKWFIAEILVNPGSFDLDNNPAEVFYKFCLPNGDPVCYRGTISGSTCGSCNNPIVSNATCDPLQSGHMPGMYVHTGTVTFTIPSSFDECLNHTKGSDLVIN